MIKKIVKEVEINGKKLVLETGELASRANMAVKASYGDTVVLVTVVSGVAAPDIDFFPLTVNYEEKLYASGTIKSSRFVKRDGKGTDEAVITKRLIDHAIRPLFPKDYMDEVQVIVTVLSLDACCDPEVLSMVATSAALTASDIPWNGPMASIRDGIKGDEMTINPPSSSELRADQLDMMLSFVGEDKRLLALEAEINMLPEDKVLSAINFGRDKSDPIFKLLNEFTNEVNPQAKKYAYESKAVPEDMLIAIRELAGEEIKLSVRPVGESDAEALKEAMTSIEEKVITTFEGKYKKSDMQRALKELEKEAMKSLVLEEGLRVDGRGEKDIRELTAKIGVLPRTHGTGLFTRGQTQVLTVATLGSPSLELLIQDMYGERTKRYIHYYNFAPFATGEVGRTGAPKSREIGHGMLAEKALRPVIPDQKEFPYMVMLVSETLSSNGSSSMASACASTLALMDAGVPIKEMVAGIAMGLVFDEKSSKYRILTDLNGLEDGLGVMDFKVAGTAEGVTAIQVDMKVAGLPFTMVSEIFDRSREARLKVLDVMKQTISTPKAGVSEFAPKLLTTIIAVEKIGVIIGSGGKTIKEIQEKTGSEIFIEDDGSVTVSADTLEKSQKALEIINALVRDVEVGEIFDGEVVDLLDFGALVEILPGKVGLLHVSEIANSYVENVADHFSVGDKVKVKVVGLGEHGKISLSKKALDQPEGQDSGDYIRRNDSRNSRGNGRGRNRR